MARRLIELYKDGNYPNLIKSETFLTRYDRILDQLQTDQPVIVELGVASGDSLRLWRDRFPKGTVLGFDVKRPKSLPDDITFFHGRQDNRDDLLKLVEPVDVFDIVIDDCSHLAGPTRIAFETLFRYLRHGGFYIIEDWGTGYWPQWPDGERPRGTNHFAGMVGFVKELVDGVGIPAINRLRNPPSIHEANWSTENSPYEYVTFYPGMVVVKKAQPLGEPMHSPRAHMEPTAGERLID